MDQYIEFLLKINKDSASEDNKTDTDLKTETSSSSTESIPRELAKNVTLTPLDALLLEVYGKHKNTPKKLEEKKKAILLSVYDKHKNPPQKVEEQKKDVREGPPALFFTGDTTHRQYVKMVTKIFPEDPKGREAEPRPLFHVNFKIDPVFKIESLPFNEDIRGAFSQLKFLEPKGIQTYMWPAIFRGHSSFIISPPKGGKTMSYIPILCNHLYNIHPGLPKENSPVALVICPKIAIVEKITNMFNLILKSTSKSENVRAFSHRFNMVLQENTDIVITTPRIFVDLCREKVFSLNRLCYVVIEEAHEIFELFLNEMYYLMTKMENILEKRTDFITIQIIAVSQKWTRPLEEFCLTLQIPPAVCMDDHIQAAFYGRTNIKLHFAQSDTKGYKVIEVLERNLYKGYKTVIICDTICQKMLDYLDVHGILYFKITEKSDHADLIKRWRMLKKGNYYALVCTDKVFKTKFPVTDAEIIVQYDLPQNMSDFSLRFSGFVDRYDSIHNTDMEKLHRNDMHIIIDGTEFDQLFKIFEQLYSTFSGQYLNLYKCLKRKHEERKLKDNIRLCEKFLLFDACKALSCPYRHILSRELDISTYLPHGDSMKVNILFFESPVKLICRIKELISDPLENGKSPDQCVEFNNDYDIIAKKLYWNKYRFIPMEDIEIKLGLYCIAEVHRGDGKVRGTLERGKIMELDENYENILVRFIDLGFEKYVSKYRLYHLPDSLFKYNEQTVIVYIKNIVPLDYDVTWPICYNVWLNNELQKLESQVFGAKVDLQLGEGVFVEDLFLYENEEINKNVSILKILEQLNIVPNCTQVDKLRDLCKESDISLNYD